MSVLAADGARRDLAAHNDTKAGSATASNTGAADGQPLRPWPVAVDDMSGTASPAAPWTQRRLNEALAELGPLRPASSAGDAPVDAPVDVLPAALPSPLAETALAAAVALSRHSPLLVQATLPASSPEAARPVARSPEVSTSPLGRPIEPSSASVSSLDEPRETVVHRPTADGISLDASQLVRALAEGCDRETLASVPPPPAPPRAAVSQSPLPPPPPVHARSLVDQDSDTASRGDLVPAWFIVPPPTPASLLVDDEAGERPPMIIERAIAEAEHAASEASGTKRSQRGKASLPSAWPPLAAGFGLAAATGALLYAVLVAG